MEPLYYDVNFLRKGTFSSGDIKKLIEYFASYNTGIKAIIITNHDYSEYNQDFIEKTNYDTKEIILNKENIEYVFEKNIITDLYINLNHFCNLHIYIGFLNHETDIGISNIGFYYNIDDTNEINFEKDLFVVIGNEIFKGIEFLDPDTVNTGEVAIPVSIEEFRKGVFERDYVFINNRFINKEFFEKNNKKLIFQKMTNGYFFVINKNENILKEIIL